MSIFYIQSVCFFLWLHRGQMAHPLNQDPEPPEAKRRKQRLTQQAVQGKCLIHFLISSPHSCPNGVLNFCKGLSVWKPLVWLSDLLHPATVPGWAQIALVYRPCRNQNLIWAVQSDVHVVPLRRSLQLLLCLHQHANGNLISSLFLVVSHISRTLFPWRLNTLCFSPSFLLSPPPLTLIYRSFPRHRLSFFSLLWCCGLANAPNNMF